MPTTKKATHFTLAPTNLHGVSVKRPHTDVHLGASNLGLLLDPKIHTQLLQMGTPGAQRFRNEILAHPWRPENLIVPILKPQPGVTHRLKSRTKETDGVFTSNSWAGSVIVGTWTAAFGIWKIPSVSRPAVPFGERGDWNSSSWVGIDGWNSNVTPDSDSNDVLQAGIQQEVDANGDTHYVAWYEWFAPKQPNSPDYINQTNIDNMPVSPGDTVFAAAIYIDGKGEVFFGNMTRGQFFNLVLDAPPGATFDGASSEWIMEAPGKGEPATSLPRFTPLVFSTAFSTGPADASGNPAFGNPAKGDLTNINIANRNLTGVTLGEEELEIDYLGAGWFQLHPETVFDRTTQRVAVVSRTPNNLDLFVIGFDNVVYSTFWNADSGWNPGGWFQLHPETKFDHTKQQISVVSRTPNNLDLFVIGFDNVVYSTFWSAAGGWNSDGWFQLHPETTFDHTSQQIAVVTRTANNLDLFVIGFDNVVYSNFWNGSSGWNPGGWFQLHPETRFDHASQQIAVVARTPENLDLFVIGFDNVVYSTFWNGAGGWNPGGWFQLHPETRFDHTSQRPSVVSRTSDNLDLFVIGFDNVVWSIFWTGTGGWNPGGWFQLHSETKFDHASQQLAVVSRTPNNLDLFVIGFDNVVWSIFWNSAGGWNPGGWFQLDPLTTFDHSTQELAAIARSPNNLDLFAIGFDNAVWSTFWNAAGGWA